MATAKFNIKQEVTADSNALLEQIIDIDKSTFFKFDSNGSS